MQATPAQRLKAMCEIQLTRSIWNDITLRCHVLKLPRIHLRVVPVHVAFRHFKNICQIDGRYMQGIHNLPNEDDVWLVILKIVAAKLKLKSVDEAIQEIENLAVINALAGHSG